MTGHGQGESAGSGAKLGRPTSWPPRVAGGSDPELAQHSEPTGDNSCRDPLAGKYCTVTGALPSGYGAAAAIALAEGFATVANGPPGRTGAPRCVW